MKRKTVIQSKVDSCEFVSIYCFPLATKLRIFPEETTYAALHTIYSCVSIMQAGSIKRAGRDEFFIHCMKNCEQGGKICNLLDENLRAG